MQATRPVIGTTLQSDLQTIEDRVDGTIVAVPEVGDRYNLIVREADGTYVVLDEHRDIVDVYTTFDHAEESVYCNLIVEAVGEIGFTVPESAAARAMVNRLLRPRPW